MAEASAKHEEANLAAAEMIANQMAGGLSEKLKRQADEAHVEVGESGVFVSFFVVVGIKIVC